MIGKRTYYVAAAMGLVSIVYGLGGLTQEQWQSIMGVLAGLGTATMRAAISQPCPPKEV